MTPVIAQAFAAAFFAVVWIQACAPARRPSPRPPVAPAPASPPPQVALLPKPPETLTVPLPVESKIKEEPLKETRLPPPKSREAAPHPVPGREPAPSSPTEDSLIAKITPKTPPPRAVSLRLTEEGRKLLEAGDYAKALSRLERTIAIDSTNPYGYYYLAKAHHHMGRYRESINFLDVAESLLAKEPHWLAEVFALKGENFVALGLLQRANSSYSEAIRLNPANRVAAEGLSRLKDGGRTIQR